MITDLHKLGPAERLGNLAERRPARSSVGHRQPARPMAPNAHGPLHPPAWLLAPPRPLRIAGAIFDVVAVFAITAFGLSCAVTLFGAIFHHFFN